ncbi:aldo/keto reductase [Paenibacillus illinoisensis]|uniref:aldo/keto reductase n=1 Tax=Paenibacillus illinoisensis TaxID=59845 RepID=UPI001C8EA78D|nr:aldo/keto reductase [Paenibacillus illinoisensis]MBY0215358.1 aldo/keto reductase [Paenibacillus illinoisensis]
MEYRYLGKTGTKVSAFALGGSSFGTRASEDESIKIIDEALDFGINLIDTSNIYGKGESERIIGKAIKNKRQNVIVASKFGAEAADKVNQNGAYRGWIRTAVEQSLLRLQTDYIDLYQLHLPFEFVAYEEILMTLNDLVKEGKIHHIGTSNHLGWQMVHAQNISDRYHIQRFVSEQTPYSMINRRMEFELAEIAKLYELSLFVYSPLSGGLLTGKYKAGQAAQSDSRAATLKGYADTLDPELAENEYKFKVIEKLQQLANEAGISLADMAIAFTQSHPFVTSTLWGPRTIDQLQAYISGSKVKLDTDVLDAIDAINPPGKRIDDKEQSWTPEWMSTERRRR